MLSSFRNVFYSLPKAFITSALTVTGQPELLTIQNIPKLVSTYIYHKPNALWSLLTDGTYPCQVIKSARRRCPQSGAKLENKFYFNKILENVYMCVDYLQSAVVKSKSVRKDENESPNYKLQYRI